MEPLAVFRSWPALSDLRDQRRVNVTAHMTTAAIIHMGMRKPIFTSQLIAPFSGVLFYRFIAGMQLHRWAYICQTPLTRRLSQSGPTARKTGSRLFAYDSQRRRGAGLCQEYGVRPVEGQRSLNPSLINMQACESEPVSQAMRLNKGDETCLFSSTRKFQPSGCLFRKMLPSGHSKKQ
jgi:hypothetical protein